jgi:uncharacterized membrane protein
MGVLASIQGTFWCPECTGGWGMLVMLIFWILILILIALIVWIFYRILSGGGRPRRGPRGGPGTGGGPGDGI